MIFEFILRKGFNTLITREENTIKFSKDYFLNFQKNGDNYILCKIIFIILYNSKLFDNY